MRLMMWISLSNSSPSMAPMKMNCSSSYRRPNTKWLMEYWYIFCRVCSSVEWIEKGTEWNRRFWVRISGYLSMKAVIQMLFSSDSQQFCGAEQPSTHSLERHLQTSAVRSRTVGFVGCLTWCMEERSEATMASCTAPLEQIHPHPASR